MRRLMWIFLGLILFPRIFLGAALIEEPPLFSIKGKESLLNRPEGIAFSPCGKFAMIANSSSNNILFYAFTKAQNKPESILKSSFKYPHDAVYSPMGEHIAVASRGNNKVTIHKINDLSLYEENPLKVIEGKCASLNGISCVKYHPGGKILAIGDVSGHKVALFRIDGEEYDTVPYQTITARIDILDKPDGLAFSKDGRLLAVISHGTHALLLYEKIPGADEYYPDPMQILQSDFSFPHSVCFHPIDDTLVVSSAGGRKTLALFEKISENPPYYSIKPTQVLSIYNPATIHLQKEAPEEGGVKGVAFSLDGLIIGICASDIADPNKSVLFYRLKNLSQ